MVKQTKLIATISFTYLFEKILMFSIYRIDELSKILILAIDCCLNVIEPLECFILGQIFA